MQTSAVRGLRYSSHIAPDDEMFVAGREQHYFGVCDSALRLVSLALESAQTPKVARVLDLPCGHGRVLRGLRAMFPEAELVACDLLRSGVDFCAREFGAVPVYSLPDPEQIPVAREFDLIWVGSLLTHLDHDAWERFLRFYSARLSPRGVLVFTTHGRNTIRHIARRDETYGLRDSQLTKLAASYARHGFGYQPYAGNPDYGISVSSMAAVSSLIARHPELKLCFASEMSWDQHQDTWAVTRITEEFTAPTDSMPGWFRAAQTVLPERVIQALKTSREAVRRLGG